MQISQFSTAMAFLRSTFPLLCLSLSVRALSTLQPRMLLPGLPMVQHVYPTFREFDTCGSSGWSCSENGATVTFDCGETNDQVFLSFCLFV